MADADLLAQSVIDGLFAIRAGTAGEDRVEPVVRPFSFVRPMRLGQRTVLALETAQGTLLHNLRKALTAQLRTAVEVAAIGMENVYYSELALALGSPCAAYLFKVGRKGEGTGILDWGIETGLALVDRLLGGSGHPAVLERALTQIEQGVLSPLSRRAVTAVADAWSDIVPVSRDILAFAANPAPGRFAQAEDRYLAMLLRLTTDSFAGTMTVGLPFAPPEPAEVGPPRVPATTRSPLEIRRLLAPGGLKHARLDLSARLPVVPLRMRDVHSLRPGQILDTGLPPDTHVNVLVNGMLLYKATPGRIGGQLVLRITEAATRPLPSRFEPVKQRRVIS